MYRSILVGTRAGVISQRIREWMDLFNTAFIRPEDLGGHSNDLIARRIIESLCLPGKAFVDVGAHIGSVIDGAARHSRPSAIIAVEAIPAKAEALRRRFPRAIIHGCAVGEDEGELPFFIDVEQSGCSSLHPSRDGSQLVEIVVPIRKLDNLVGAEPVDVMKIDVEGAELAVLRGARELIARDQPTIMFESGPHEVGGHSKVGLWEWLDSNGYAVLLPNRVGHVDPGLSCDGFVESHVYPRRTTNYIAVARDRRDEIRARARLILNLDKQ